MLIYTVLLRSSDKFTTLFLQRKIFCMWQQVCGQWNTLERWTELINCGGFGNFVNSKIGWQVKQVGFHPNWHTCTWPRGREAIFIMMIFMNLSKWRLPACNCFCFCSMKKSSTSQCKNSETIVGENKYFPKLKILRLFQIFYHNVPSTVECASHFKPEFKSSKI